MGGWASKSKKGEGNLTDEAAYNLHFKILLLGAGESGKSTVVKQLKLISQIKFQPDELKAIASNLRINTLTSMQVLIDACKKLDIKFEDAADQDRAALITAFEFKNDDGIMPGEIAEAITLLWKSKPILEAWERRSEFWCLDSVDFYFENIQRFVEEDYLPDEQDLVMVRMITNGIVTTAIENPPVNFTVVDVGGQRNERRKWMHVFSDVTAVIYVANLAGFNTIVYEDGTTNRLHECLSVFESTLNTDMFANTPIYLLLNKKDLFETMIRKHDLKKCFEDYPGGQDVHGAIEFVESKFRSKLKGDGSRMKTHAVATRMKKDVKAVWEEIQADLKAKNKAQIDKATKLLKKAEKRRSKAKKTSTPAAAPAETPAVPEPVEVK
eukprot:Opistho-2@33266